MSKILIVDDNEEILQVFGNMLERGGYEVMVADSGLTCLEILKDEKPDLILMDVVMPGMNGWDVVKEIKNDEANNDIIVSMLTVKSLDTDHEKSLGEEVNADWHITKPIGQVELLKTVKSLLLLKNA